VRGGIPYSIKDTMNCKIRKQDGRAVVRMQLGDRHHGWSGKISICREATNKHDILLTAQT